MIAIGQVRSVQDPYNGERIKVKIYGRDNDIKDVDKLPWSYPLLPKMLHVKPKEGEAVLIFFENEENSNSQRFYIGPLISQPQFFNGERYGAGATTLMSGQLFENDTPVENIVKGALPKNQDIMLKGRTNTDIILTDNDVRIRCGVHTLKNGEIKFNTNDCSFIKLKYYPTGLQHRTYVQTQGSSLITPKTETIGSVANIVADKINIIGHNGNPFIKTNDVDEIISDSDVLKILDKAHQLPYGDKLCELLSDFLMMFINHSHNYSNLAIVSDDNVKAFNRKYGTTKEQLGNVILSDSVRIN